jgi:DNA-binding transcriptional ArsR family regulator
LTIPVNWRAAEGRRWHDGEVLTIDITGLPPERVTFAASPLAELTSMLHVLAEPAHHPAMQAWAGATLAGLKPALANRLLEAEFLWRSSRADFLVPGRPAERLADELDEVDRLPDDVYVAAALVTTCGSSRLSFRRGHAGAGRGSPLTDPAAADRALELAQARGPRQAAFAERLLEDPPAVRAAVRRLLEDCADAFFADAWRPVEHRLAADARHKSELHARLGLAAALEAVSPAASLSEHGGAREIRLDKLQDNWTSGTDGVTFIPSVYGRPHLLTVHAPGWRPVVQYPAADRHDPPPLSLDLVRRRLEALSHPVRLRLCRTLARGPHTTGELAEAWQLTAPEVSRHLAVLKKAGLLKTARRGRYVSHALDVSATAALGADLLEAFLR